MRFLVFIICFSCASANSVVTKDFTPEEIVVDAASSSMKYTAKLTFTANAPEGTNVVHAKALALEDLTGNVYEDGYYFPYNAAVSYIYYPEVMEGEAMVYIMRFGQINDDEEIEWWTNWSKEPEYFKSEHSDYILIKLNRTWEDAKAWCNDNNLRLATVHNENEQKAVKHLLASHGGEHIAEAWIGLYDANLNSNTSSRAWKWIDGKNINAEQMEFFETNGDNLEQEKDSNHTDSFNYVKFNIEGNFVITLIENELLDKDEFICKKMPKESVDHEEVKAGTHVQVL